MIPWILIAIAIVLVIFGVLSLLLLRKKKRPIDYYSLFIIGIIWFIFGIIVRENYFFWIMGLTFMAIGLINKDKWKSNRRRWGDMDKDERKLMIIIMIILGVLVLAGLVALFLVDKGII